MSAELVMYYFDVEGWKPCIAFQGRARTRLVIQTPRVIVRSIPNTERRHLKPLPGSVRQVARRFRSIAHRNGGTKEAVRLLRGVK